MTPVLHFWSKLLTRSHHFGCHAWGRWEVTVDELLGAVICERTFDRIDCLNRPRDHRGEVCKF